MRILVTGGNGFIGSHLVKALRERGDDVVVWDLPEHDVVTADDLPGVDLIYHLAAVSRVKASYANPMRAAEVNVGGTLNILRQAKRQNCPTIVAGTLHRGESPYAVSKLAMEHAIKHCLEVWLVRFGNVYGGGEGVVDKWQRANEIEIWGNGSTCKDFIHVDDVVAGLVSAGSLRELLKVKRVTNLCTGRLMSLEELASYYDKHISYRSPQPGDWSTEQVTPDYPVKWTVEGYLRSKR